MQRDLIIGGEDVPLLTGDYFDVVAPESGRVIGRVARAGALDVDAAVNKAREGAVAWASLAPAAREKVLLAAADIVAEQGEALFQIGRAHV